MMTATRIPGNWPAERVLTTNLRLNTNFPQAFLQIPNMASASSSRDSRDEIFSHSGQNTTANNTSEEKFDSYLAFEPVVASVSSVEPVDWRRYELPRELLEFQHSTSPLIQEMLPVSVQRLSIRHEEEERVRAAAARRERPIARVGRASVKPRREREGEVSKDPLDPASGNARSSRMSGVSAISCSSNDSGYTSMLIEPDPRPEPVTRSKRASRRTFALSSIFRRKLDFHGTTENDPPSSVSAAQIPEPTRPAPTLEPPTIECVSCLDDFELPGMVTLSCHSYCPGCFQRLISTALESETHWPAKCCLNPIPAENILPHLDNSIKTKFQQRDAEWSIPTSDRIYCTHANCSTWIPPKHVTKTLNFAKCPQCMERTCTLCRGAYHNGSDCPQDPTLQATAQLAELEGWKRCYSCHAFVEHNKGCRHMTCRCKAQFCYICGDRWRTCYCTDQQLITIQAQVASRRHEAAARTQRTAAETARREAEEEELRGIWQEIAAFERAEEERLAAELEAFRLRDEEEQRVRAEQAEQRRRVEEERLAAVHGKFQQLRLELEILSDVQRVLMVERHEHETEVLEKGRQDALDALRIRQLSETSTLAAESRRRIRESEVRFEEEYQARVEEERSIEDVYVLELRVFYDGNPDAEYRVREARDELRENQDREYRLWDGYRREQVAGVREGEVRSLEVLKGRQDSERRAVEGRAGIDEVVRRERVDAEGMWMDAVAFDRVVMLTEMEQEGYAAAGGG